MNVWLGIIDDMSADSDPREVLEHFIRTKVRMSFSHPTASRIFCHGNYSGGAVFKRLFKRLSAQLGKRKNGHFKWLDGGRENAGHRPDAADFL